MQLQFTRQVKGEKVSKVLTSLFCLWHFSFVHRTDLCRDPVKLKRFPFMFLASTYTTGICRFGTPSPYTVAVYPDFTLSYYHGLVIYIYADIIILFSLNNIPIK